MSVDAVPRISSVCRPTALRVGIVSIGATYQLQATLGMVSIEATWKMNITLIQLSAARPSRLVSLSFEFRVLAVPVAEVWLRGTAEPTSIA